MAGSGSMNLDTPSKAEKSFFRSQLEMPACYVARVRHTVHDKRVALCAPHFNSWSPLARSRFGLFPFFYDRSKTLQKLALTARTLILQCFSIRKFRENSMLCSPSSLFCFVRWFSECSVDHDMRARVRDKLQGFYIPCKI